jgi:putative membrane protein
MNDDRQAPRRGPVLIEDDDLPNATHSPAEAPPVDDLEADPQGAAATAAAIRIVGRGRSWGLGALFWSALMGLFSLAIGLWFWEVVEALLARNIWLGRAALAFAAIAGGALLAISLRELAALSRLRKADGIRETAARAHRSADRGTALAALDELNRFYEKRPDMAAARTALTDKRGDVMDGDALILLAERELMRALDQRAEDAARRGAKMVAAATAMIPLAVIDVLAALTINLRMIREIAEIYGGRAGWLGSWRLLKAVSAHLIAAGAISIGDDLIGPALGGGALAKVSRRFGEGLINGALTARIGIAAMEVCRPMAFEARSRPGVGALIKGALAPRA